MNYRRIATFTGWLWIITFVTSIPARLFFYAPVLDNEGNYVTGAGSDARTLIGIGAVLELLLIISNVGTAVVPYSIHKRVHEAGAVAYVTARLVECTFIAIGIVCMLAISSLRQDAPSGTNAAVGQGIFAVYEWTFRIGPGVFAGIGNGLILGWLMYRSGLVSPPFCPVRAGRWAAGQHRGRPGHLGRRSGRGPGPGAGGPGVHLGAGDRHLSHRQGLPDFVSGTGRDPGRRSGLARLRWKAACQRRNRGRPPALGCVSKVVATR
jgi:hypothetical protein